MLSHRIHALLLALPLVSLLPVSSIFAMETDSAIPLPSISASLQPDLFTGTLTGSIPIEVPPGRNGMQPNLALNYASSNDNSWTGVGWDLELGAIELQTKWSVLYSPSPAQENAGRVYTLRMKGISADLVPAPPPAPSGEYRAKIEGHFLRISKLSGGAGGWEVTDKKGVTYRFGTTTSTRMADPAAGTKIFKWCLEKITDRDGNYLTATYVGDNNQLYLDQISYGGNDGTGGGAVLSHTKTVKFWRDVGSRPDQVDEYTRGYRVKTRFRLNTVAINANGLLLRAYKFGYTQNPNTTTSRLDTVQQFGKDAAVDTSGTITNEPLATKYPLLSLGWQQHATQLPIPSYNVPAIANLFDGVHVNRVSVSSNLFSLLGSFKGDFNGDGMTDYMWIPDNISIDIGPWLIAYGTTAGFTVPNYNFPALPNLFDGTHFNINQTAKSTKFGDFNGDGRTDYLWMPGNGDGRLLIAYGLLGGGLSTPNYDLPALPNKIDGVHSSQSYSFTNIYEQTGDFNGDGRTDYMWIPDNSDGRWLIAYGLQGGGLSIPNYDFPALPNLFDGVHYNRPDVGVVFPGLYQKFGDFNGDGRTDYMWIPANGDGRWLIAYGLLGGGLSIPNYAFPALPPLIDGVHDSHAGSPESQQLGDFNGDGRTDFMWIPANGDGRWLIAYGAASGGFIVPNYDPPALANPFDGFHVNYGASAFGTSVDFQKLGDFNGDGKTDYMWIPANGDGRWLIAYGTEVGLTTPNYNQPALANLFDGVTANRTNTPFLYQRFGDFNGDGKTDYMWVPSNGDGRWIIAYAPSGPSLATDVLASLSTGLGGVTMVTYDPSANGSYNRVTQITTCNNWNGAACAGISSTTQYSYIGAYYHVGERDYRGVNKTTVTGPAGPNGAQTITETWFHQGNDVAVDVNNPNVAVGYTAGLPYRVRISNSTVPVVETTTSYLPDPDNAAPWFTPPAIVTTTIYNSAGALAKQTRTEFVTYDAYGNVTLSYDRGDFTNNNANATDDTTTVVSFGNYDTTNWLVAFPTAQATYAGQGIGGSKLAETKYSYDGASSCTTPVGNPTPTKGHVTKVERYLDQGGLPPISGMEYDTYGNLTCTRDPKGNKTNLAYDAATSTFPLTSTNALLHVTTTAYYGVNGVVMDTGLYGQVKTLTDSNLRTTTSTYDALGRIVTTTTPDTPNVLVATMAYNYGGTFVVGTQHVQRTISGGGLSASLVSKTYFDGLSRTTKEQQPSAADGGGALKVIVTDTEYDVRGLVRRTSLPYFTGNTVYWRTLDYDALDRVIKTTNPDTTMNQVCYNAWTTTTIDPGLHKKVETKDASGRLIAVQEYTGTQANCATTTGTLYATTNYTYNPMGNLLSVTDTKGNVSSMTHDTLGRKLTMHDPDMGNWSYVYDENGNLTKQTDAKGQVLWFQYDELNRRRQKDYTTQKALGSGDVVYSYDDTVATNNGKGRLKQVTDPAQSVTFQYDSRGRVTQTAKTLDGTTYTTTSVYDGLGRLTSMSYPANPNTTPPTPVTTVSYTYDGPQLKQVTEGATNYVTYAGWNALGQSGTATFGNGVVTTKTYANTNNTTCTQQTFRLCTLNTVSAGVPSTGAPTAPATLTATPVAASTTQLDLSWSAATDNVGVTGYRIERCQGVGCTTFLEVGTTAAGVLTFSNTGLTTGNPYTYRVRAVDGANGLGPFSPLSTAVPTDTTAPIPEGGVGIMVVSTSQIDLTWEQPTEGSYLWDYRLERCQGTSCTNFVEIAATTVTRYSDTGLTPATSYRYRVRCLDYVGNVGGYSSIYTKTTTLPADVTPPTAPGSLTATPVPSARIDLSWTAATDTGGITDYRIERCRGIGCSDFVQIARTTPPTLTYSNMANHLLDGNSYTYRVRATDATGNFGAYSVSATAVATDSVNPTVPGTPLAMANGTQAVMTWTRSTDYSDIVQYQVERCQGAGCTTFALVNTIPVTTLTDTGLTSGTVYSYRVRAVDSTNHVSGYSAVATTTTAPGVIQALTYSYDNAGNVQDLLDATVAANAGDQHFSYDDLDRLTLANGPYGASGANASFTYQYNEIGNLTLNSQLSATAYGYPTSGASSVRPHAVSTAGANSYTYDNNGNMLTGAGRTLTWNSENKPLTVVQGGTTTTFVYDGDGGRVKKIVGSTTTRYISKLYECDNTNCSRFVWAGSTRIATIASNGTINYWHGDHLGSSSVITDSTGTKVEALTYYPYGGTRTNQSFTTPAIDVPYKYTGKELDNTGLYYYEARYYDATVGRFLSADTLVPNPEDPQDLNRYSYVDNNPLRYTDPSGHAVSCATNDGSHFCNSLATQNGQPIVFSYFQPQVARSAQSGGFVSGSRVPLRRGCGFSCEETSAPGPNDQFYRQIFDDLANGRYITALLFSLGINPSGGLGAGSTISTASKGIGAAKATTTALSEIRYTQAGERFIRYESGSPAFSRITASGGVKPGTFAAPASDGLVPLGQRVPVYNLTSPGIARPNVVFLEPPAGTAIIGPRPVPGGTGSEVLFPFGF